jgi:hypothetical protein
MFDLQLQQTTMKFLRWGSVLSSEIGKFHQNFFGEMKHEDIGKSRFHGFQPLCYSNLFLIKLYKNTNYDLTGNNAKSW